MLPPEWGHHERHGVRRSSLYSRDDQTFIFSKNGLKTRYPTGCDTYKCLIDHNGMINRLLIIQYMDYSQVTKTDFKVSNTFLHKSEYTPKK